MSTLRTILTNAVGGVSLLGLVTAANAQDVTPDLNTITDGAETLIQGTDAQQDLSGIEYRFRGLATDAETRATYLEIKELLPTINEEIAEWRRDFSNDKTPFPTSENIGKLQDLLGITGNDRDRAFGPQVARSLAYLATTPIGKYGDDKLPKLDLEGRSDLSTHISNQAPRAYNRYLEGLSETQTALTETVTTELAAETERAAKLTQIAFESCTGEQLAIDKDQFIRDIVEALDSEGGDVDAAIGEGCKSILDLTKTPEEREALLTSLQTNLSDDISAMRDVITTEHERATLQELFFKHPDVAGNLANIFVYGEYGRPKEAAPSSAP